MASSIEQPTYNHEWEDFGRGYLCLNCKAYWHPAWCPMPACPPSAEDVAAARENGHNIKGS